ncbi:MAG: PssE/Cps14G family polysaccharide biosynthesis glycosyltransferase [Pirellulaceae bacterium]
MIFVTVGTTHFDELIEEVDRLRGGGEISEHVYAQIGSGKYVPQHLEWVRYLDNIQEVMKKADLIVCHSGTGTVFELLNLRKAFITVPNRRLKDDHQADLVKALESEGWCNCCWELSHLRVHLANMRHCEPYPANPGPSQHLWAEVLSVLSKGSGTAVRVSDEHRSNVFS